MRYDYSDKKTKPLADPLSEIISAIKGVKLETGTIIRQQTGLNYMLNETRDVLMRLEKIISRLERVVKEHDKWEREEKE